MPGEERRSWRNGDRVDTRMRRNRKQKDQEAPGTLKHWKKVNQREREGKRGIGGCRAEGNRTGESEEPEKEEPGQRRCGGTDAGEKGQLCTAMEIIVTSGKIEENEMDCETKRGAEHTE